MIYNSSNFLMTAGLLARELGIKVPIRVMILDDDPTYFPIFKMLLDKSGTNYIVKCVTSCDEAEKEIKDSNKDIYVIDVGLTECNGLDFVEKMQSLYGLFPFVFLTGNNMSDRVGMSRDCLTWIHKLDCTSPESLDRSMRYAIKSWHMRDIRCNKDCEKCRLNINY